MVGGGALYYIICKRGAKQSGGTLYDTAMIICKGGAKTVRGV